MAIATVNGEDGVRSGLRARLGEADQDDKADPD
jgi:hypothetical protein